MAHALGPGQDRPGPGPGRKFEIFEKLFEMLRVRVPGTGTIYPVSRDRNEGPLRTPRGR